MQSRFFPLVVWAVKCLSLPHRKTNNVIGQVTVKLTDLNVNQCWSCQLRCFKVTYDSLSGVLCYPADPRVNVFFFKDFTPHRWIYLCIRNRPGKISVN